MMERFGRAFLSKDLWTLTVLSGVETHDFSPLGALEINSDEYSAPEVITDSVARMIEKDLLQEIDDEGHLGLVPEFADQVKAVQDPTELIGILFEAPLQGSTFYFARRQGQFTMYYAKPDVTEHALQYPYQRVDMVDWIMTEVAYRTDSPMPRDHERSLKLSMGQTLVLLAMQALLAHKVEEFGAPLSTSLATISRQDLSQFFETNGALQWSFVGGNDATQRMAFNLANNPQLLEQMGKQLVDHGLLDPLSEQGFHYTPWGMSLFDVGRLMDRAMIRVQRRTESGWQERGGSLVFYPDRILLFLMDHENAGLNIEVLNPDGVRQWLENITAETPTGPALEYPNPKPMTQAEMNELMAEAEAMEQAELDGLAAKAEREAQVAAEKAAQVAAAKTAKEAEEAAAKAKAVEDQALATAVDPEDETTTAAPFSVQPTVQMHVPRTGQVWSLECTGGPHQGDTFPIDDLCHAGRGEDNDIVLADGRTSRRHVRFSNRGGLIYVSDLGSTNGTKVNGVEIKDDTILKDGDEVVLGKTHLVLRAEVVTTEQRTIMMNVDDIKAQEKPQEPMVQAPAPPPVPAPTKPNFCSGCGQPLKNEARFCGKCGKNV